MKHYLYINGEIKSQGAEARIFNTLGELKTWFQWYMSIESLKKDVNTYQIISK